MRSVPGLSAAVAPDRRRESSEPMNAAYVATANEPSVLPCWIRSVASQVNEGVAMVVSFAIAALNGPLSMPGTPGSFRVSAAAAAAGTGSRTTPDNDTSYQSCSDENVTVALELDTVAVRLKVTVPPAARRLSRQVVVPGVVETKPTAGAS